jgi:hypothetical protein
VGAGFGADERKSKAMTENMTAATLPENHADYRARCVAATSAIAVGADGWTLEDTQKGSGDTRQLWRNNNDGSAWELCISAPGAKFQRALHAYENRELRGGTASVFAIRGDVGERTAEHRDYPVVDSKGRRVGGLVSLRADAWVDADGAYGNWVPASELGVTRYLYTPSSTRDGNSFGAICNTGVFTTEAARDAAVTKYFRSAEKRYTRNKKFAASPLPVVATHHVIAEPRAVEPAPVTAPTGLGRKLELTVQGSQTHLGI